jgi:hypothetical protein
MTLLKIFPISILLALTVFVNGCATKTRDIKNNETYYDYLQYLKQERKGQDVVPTEKEALRLADIFLYYTCGKKMETYEVRLKGNMWNILKGSPIDYPENIIRLGGTFLIKISKQEGYIVEYLIEE